MPSCEIICGQRIDYEPPTCESLSEHEDDLLEAAYSEVEDTLAIIAEIQEERANDGGDITEPLTLIQIRTVLEIGVQVERSLTVLKALSGDLERSL
jgi:hypothetical protein